jgi:ribose-phosphate pyrophosphokinase
MILVACDTNFALAQEMALLLQKPLLRADIMRFSNGEICASVKVGIPFSTAVIVHSTPTNDSLLQLLLIAERLTSLGAQTLVAVVPFLGYSRADDTGGARWLMPKLFKAAGIAKIITLDLHSYNAQADKAKGRFEEFDSMLSIELATNVYKYTRSSEILEEIKKQFFKDREYANKDRQYICSVSCAPLFIRLFTEQIFQNSRSLFIFPDAGAHKRINKSSIIDIDFVCLQKNRQDQAKLITYSDDANIFAGKNCVIIDDILDSGQTIFASAKLLHQHGAASVSAAVTHGIFGSGALELIKKAELRHLYISNSIFAGSIAPQTQLISCANILAKKLCTLPKNLNNWI